MKAPRRLIVLLITSLTGFAISIYQTFHFFETRFGNASFNTFCNINETVSCTAVDASKYSELIPGFPLSSFAAGWFLAMFIAVLFARNPFWRREALRALLVFVTVGSVFSVIYLYIMAELIKSYCVLCLGIDALNWISLAIVLSLKPEGFSVHKPDRAKWKTLTTVTAICLALTVFGTYLVNPLPSNSDKVDEIVKYTFSQKQELVPLTDKDIFIGPADAPVTIVKFSDFQCPACRKGAYAIHPLMERFQGKIKFVFKNFPLDPACNAGVTTRGHEFACLAAKIAVCANNEGKFQDVYRLFFDHQTEFSNERLMELATEGGLNSDSLRMCLENSETHSSVVKNIEEGTSVKIESTPTFFINGYRINGAYPTTIWIALVEELLKKNK